MSDDIDALASAEVQPAAAALPPAAFGERLKWERERAGLTVSDVAARLRLHPNQIRALEQESFAKLPEAAYVRGFVRSYTRIFNVDAAPLLDDLASKLGPTAGSVVDGMSRARDYSPVQAAAREQASRRFVVFGAILLLITLGALGWYAARQKSETAATTVPTPAPVAAATPAPSPVVTATEAAPAASAPPSQVASAEPVAVMEPVPTPPLLRLRFTGPSWAEVKDAEGKVLHSQHNVAGTEQVIEGTPPFYVVIGDATKTAVEVRGEAYDLVPYSRQNVARFTIN
jgi:cytoskeleton protein RodZ